MYTFIANLSDFYDLFLESKKSHKIIVLLSI